MRKYITLLIIGFFCITSALAQSGLQFINYQGVARDASGQALASASISLRLSICSDAAGNTALYIETHQLTTDARGLFSIKIGAGTASLGTFSGVTWNTGDRYLKAELIQNGNPVLLAVTQLVAVPYALYAEKANQSSSAIQLIATGSSSAISAASETNPSFSSYTLTSGAGTYDGTTFTAATAGTYLVSFMVYLTVVPSSWYMGIAHGGVATYTSVPQVGWGSVTAVAILSAGGTIKPIVYSPVATSIASIPYVRFTITRLN
ncbi:hypothetical protein [Spirosoma gilvum]